MGPRIWPESTTGDRGDKYGSRAVKVARKCPKGGAKKEGQQILYRSLHNLSTTLSGLAQAGGGPGQVFGVTCSTYRRFTEDKGAFFFTISTILLDLLLPSHPTLTPP